MGVGSLTGIYEALSLQTPSKQIPSATGSRGDGCVGHFLGPIELIKHGQDVQIPACAPLTVSVDEDIWLPPIN